MRKGKRSTLSVKFLIYEKGEFLEVLDQEIHRTGESWQADFGMSSDKDELKLGEKYFEGNEEKIKAFDKKYGKELGLEIQEI